MVELLLVLLALGLVLLNAFFVATEFAIVKVRDTQIQELASRGVGRALAAQEVLGKLDAYLSACQFGITLASLGLGWVGEPAFADLLEPLFRGLGGGATWASHTTAVVLAFLAITVLHIVFGELAPKTLAIQRPQATALWVAWPIQWFYRLLYPFIWSLNGLANWTVRALGLDPAADPSASHSEEELRLILAGSQRSGQLSEAHTRLLINALDFPDQAVRQIMVPRGDIAFLRVGDSVERVREVASRTGHTRYPVCDDELDRVVGVLHVKDLFLRAASGNVDLVPLLREPLFVPETTQVGRLLELFRRRRSHLAVVIDEYGGTSGIVTLEDVLEELTGEIQDEYDREAPKVRQMRDGRLSVDAGLPLDDAATALGIVAGNAGVETIGGLVFTELGRVARPGDEVTLCGRRVRVGSVQVRRIVRLIVDPADSTDEGGPQPG